MSNESTRIHLAQSSPNRLVRPIRSAVARKLMACGLLVLLTAFGSGCDDDNGSSSNKSPAVKLVSEPVDLPPGQTEAAMAWEPSPGSIDSYLIFLSRNGSVYQFSASSPTPNITISGEGGDQVRITVIAVSENGAVSDNSPPSAPVRFHPPVDASPDPSEVAAATKRTESPAAEVVVAAASATTSPVADTGTNTDTDAAPEGEDEPAAAEAQEDNATAENREEEDESRAALLERLLLADARLASPAARSNQVENWIQSFVDEELASGVQFVGTGDLNGDDTRELVFKDSAGQLFIADGPAFLDATFTDDASTDNSSADAVTDSINPADTLIPALRLSASERFVALEDFGNGMGAQWLIEDDAAGTLALVDANDGTTEIAAPLSSSLPSGDRLALIGHGDFNGDGRLDLAWRSLDGEDRLLIGPATADWTPSESATMVIPEMRRGDVHLAIADLNGNGQDDLLSRDDTGRLRVTFFLADEDVTPDGAEGNTEAFWIGGADISTAGLDPVGTYDSDEDGDAEIAWIDGSGIQTWDVHEGLE